MKLDMIEKVRQALGRSAPLSTAPVPPQLDEPIIRLVHSDVGLSELLAKTATDNGILVEPVRIDELLERLVDFLKSQEVKRIALADTPLLQQLNLAASLANAGFDAQPWSRLTLDQLYDFDAGLTDVYAAVAEIGGLVVRASLDHGRALSLVPRVHIAIIEPRKIVPDLLDLLQKLSTEGIASSTTIITGPSKTADIESVLVFGVHGPTTVKAYFLT